ncbi:galactosyltransferase-related protein [Alkalihalobacterium chitinilyticum]|uniref:Galactosyltransferase-related protein n=1 Tax=Alkalihalobacterium chitinilyticum TaxID=2980103 RepID=A0ABT5VB22_9BACI|nr:galactosyltransferase-related protein [Alkalihalobacterium chitinilyticum]MDE5412672.1 galactosyltransferase-related protein [Alkalihalobacterium chitinilyticum]
MLDEVSVLIPFKPSSGIRSKLFEWVLSYYENVLPDVEICIGENDEEPFNKSKAINTAAAKATKNIFVVVDSDIVYNPQIIKKSVQLLESHAWVIPYNRCLDITARSTEKLLNSHPQWPFPLEIEYKERFNKSAYESVGGMNILFRKDFNIVKGFDERFKGWGREDDAFKNAMNTLCGPYKRIEDEYIYHLWHPKVGMKGNPHFSYNQQLYRQYVRCNGKVKRMQALINSR